MAEGIATLLQAAEELFQQDLTKTGPVLPGRVQICRRLHTEEGQEEVPGPRSSGRSSP